MTQDHEKLISDYREVWNSISISKAIALVKVKLVNDTGWSPFGLMSSLVQENNAVAHASNKEPFNIAKIQLTSPYC